jgi:hypothetical protein
MVLQSSESIFSSLPGYFGSCSVAFGLSGGEIQSRCTELFRKILSCCTKHADKAISSPATWFSTRESLFHQKRYGKTVAARNFRKPRFAESSTTSFWGTSANR